MVNSTKLDFCIIRLLPVSYFFKTMPIDFFDQHVMRHKKIILPTITLITFLKQPRFRVLTVFRYSRLIGCQLNQMFYFNTSLCKRMRHENCTMTINRILFGAKQSYHIATGKSCLHTIQAMLKKISRYNSIIINRAIDIATPI